MEILHTISSIDLAAGGPSKSVSDLAINQALQGQKVTIFTYASANPYIKESSHPNLVLNFVSETPYKQALNDHLTRLNYDLLHGHGIWQMPVHKLSHMARKKKIPYIITPRGMLEPWALNVGKWKKKLAMSLYQYNDLAKAACIHATAQMEAENIRKLGFKNPIAVIPNGVDLSEFSMPLSKRHNGKRTVLFLSRVHPKKGIDLLIEAWAKLDINIRQNWQVQIAGNGDAVYVASLQQLIVSKGLDMEIDIVGPQFGDDKLDIYKQADLFVLPTYCENFGIVVAEAMACCLPVITTTGTPWEELNTCHAGWWIEIGVEPLIEALKQAMQLSDQERQLMGQNGRKLVEENYSIESVAAKMIRLYDWILKGGEKPEFVN